MTSRPSAQHSTGSAARGRPDDDWCRRPRSSSACQRSPHRHPPAAARPWRRGPASSSSASACRRLSARSWFRKDPSPRAECRAADRARSRLRFPPRFVQRRHGRDPPIPSCNCAPSHPAVRSGRGSPPTRLPARVRVAGCVPRRRAAADSAGPQATWLVLSLSDCTTHQRPASGRAHPMKH